jgi:hypothetical protein
MLFAGSGQSDAAANRPRVLHLRPPIVADMFAATSWEEAQVDLGPEEIRSGILSKGEKVSPVPNKGTASRESLVKGGEPCLKGP